MLLFAVMASAQEIRTINGKVEDASSGYPLPFASVALMNSSFSNVANSEGEFSLKIPQENMNDSLLVSCLGYRNLKVAVADFIGKRNRRIKLEPTALDIRSITVRSDDAAELFKSAFSSRYIKKNYPSEAAGMSGFYRETIRKGSKYISLSEVVVDIMKQPYTSLIGDNIAIYKGRGNTNRNVSDGKWYMDYARIDLRFNAKYKGKWLKNKYDITTELAITDTDNKDAMKIPAAERFRMKDILQKKVADFQDDNFWENYNIIEPDAKIETIINRIIRQLKRERD